MFLSLGTFSCDFGRFEIWGIVPTPTEIDAKIHMDLTS